MIRINPLLKTDSYKVAHPRLYPDGMTKAMTYTESRGGPLPFVPWVGMNIFLHELDEFTVTKEDVEEAREFYEKHFMGADIFPYDEWMIVVNEYHGKPPVRIRAVPEGTVVPNHNVLMTVESTDARLPWMAGWLETITLRAGWFAPTFAAGDFDIACTIYKYLTLTSDAPDALFPSRNHDFGARGASCSEEAAIGGAVHTLFSGGSDTLEGIYIANKYYGFDMAAYSIPATEHSVTTAHLKGNENLVVNKILNRFPGAPFVATVADSYSMKNFVDVIIGKEMKEAIQSSGKVLVVRPDSGDAITNVVYILKSLEQNFGVTVNGKGYKVLNGVAVINGDGNDPDQIRAICAAVMDAGFALDNVAFGTGGGLYRKNVTRDTYKFATKLCYAVINGQEVSIRKEVEDQPDKRSKGGLLDLVSDGGRYQTVNRLDKMNPLYNAPSVLETIYDNGKITYSSGEVVRERLMNAIKKSVEENLALGKVRF